MTSLLIPRARALRQSSTDVERRLWARLRGRRLQGAKFRRQLPLGPYVVDFACVEAGLVVELDGSQHLGSASDATRDAHLACRGYRVLRFWNNEVLENLEGVLERIAELLPGTSPSYPPVSPEEKG